MASNIKINHGTNIKSFTPTTQKHTELMGKMETEIVAITNSLFLDASKFDEKKTREVYLKIYGYIAKYDRILYSVISNSIYDYFDKHTEDSSIDGTLLSNLDCLIDYAYSPDAKNANMGNNKANIQDDTKRAIIKIRDHVNLAMRQYRVLKQSDEEYMKRFEASIAPYEKQLTKDMNSQLLTLVGMFTALAFLVFGGISSLDNIFNTHGIPLLKIFMVTCVWMLGLINLIFVFLYCVGKLTNTDFTSRKAGDLIQRYPLVSFADLLLICLICIFGWIYFLSQYQLIDWFPEWVASNTIVITVIGTTIMAGISVVLFILFFRHIRTNESELIRQYIEDVMNNKIRTFYKEDYKE